MPDKVYEFIAVIVVILILTVLTWLAYLLIATEVDTNVKVAVLASLGAVSAALATHWLTKTREIEARHFEKKRQCYEAIMKTFSRLFTSEQVGKKISQQQLTKAIVQHRLDIAIWADKDLIDWWLKISNQPAGGISNKDALNMGEQLIRAIRKELGKDDDDIQNGYLISLFLKESPEKVLQMMDS